MAALKTIEILTRDKVWEHLVRIGNRIGEGWLELAKKHGINLKVTDFKPLITMRFEYGDDNNAIVTLFTQEMLKRGYLAATSVYVSLAHTDTIVDEYLDHVDGVFDLLSGCIRSGTVSKRLETRIRSDSFRRLT